MAIEVILHMPNAEPILGEIDKLPDPQDQIIQIHNPRLRDGKDLHYLQSNVTSVFWVINQLSFIEILPGEEDEEIIGFVRE
jgi:hypothetical protein